MLDHLLSADAKAYIKADGLDVPEPIKRVTTTKLLDAQATTASWLEKLGVPPDTVVVEEQQREAAREAFQLMSSGADENDTKYALMRMEAPLAVRQLIGMLTAYDWQFVQQAKEIRGYVMAKIMQETTHPDARIRLRALEMAGKVTEVAMFTERVEVKKTEMSDAELDTRIKEKLNKLQKVVDVTDVSDATTTPPVPVPITGVMPEADSAPLDDQHHDPLAP